MTGFNSKRDAAADKLQEPEREALKLALTTLEGWNNHGKWVWPETALEQAKRNTEEAITAITAALAQPAQEPAVWIDDYNACKCPDNEARCFSDKVFRMMQKYTTPPKREWNFCERCGKRTKDLTVIHTCTPPQENT